MKKFVFIVATILIFSINSAVVNAKNVRLSELSAEELITSIKNLAYNKKFQKVISLSFMDSFETSRVDFPQLNPPALAYHYGVENSSEPEGEILFFVDDEGKVVSVEIVCYSKENAVTGNFTALMVFTCLGLGITGSEYFFLVEHLDNRLFGDFETSHLWCESIKREVALLLCEHAKYTEGIQFTIFAIK